MYSFDKNLLEKYIEELKEDDSSFFELSPTNIFVSLNKKDIFENFYNELKNKYEKFISKRTAHFRSTNCKTNSPLKIITEEELIKSPLTFILADWGMGKTHFCIEFISYWKELRTNKFIDNIFYIDCLKFAGSDNPANEIFSFLLNSLSSSLNVSFKFLYKWLIGNISFSFLWVTYSMPNINNQNDEYILKKLNKKINNNKFLLFFDNLDRIDQNEQKKLLMSIRKISMLNNFIILLPYNGKLFAEKYNIFISKNEVEKYCDITPFALKVNYNVLEEKKIDKNIIDILKILKLSLRDIIKIIDNENVNKYKFMKNTLQLYDNQIVHRYLSTIEYNLEYIYDSFTNIQVDFSLCYKNINNSLKNIDQEIENLIFFLKQKELDDINEKQREFISQKIKEIRTWDKKNSSIYNNILWLFSELDKENINYDYLVEKLDIYNPIFLTYLKLNHKQSIISNDNDEKYEFKRAFFFLIYSDFIIKKFFIDSNEVYLFKQGLSNAFKNDLPWSLLSFFLYLKKINLIDDLEKFISKIVQFITGNKNSKLCNCFLEIINNNVIFESLFEYFWDYDQWNKTYLCKLSQPFIKGNYNNLNDIGEKIMDILRKEFN